MATTVDLMGSVTGIFTKPIEEYRVESHRRANEMRMQDPTSSGHANKPDNGSTRFSGQHSVSSTAEDSPTGKSRKDEHNSLAGHMMGASAKSIGSFAPKALKGMVVDIPLAITEGMRAVPSHYGDAVRDHGQVTDIKSGVVVAGKTFAWGFVDGLSDMVVQPYKGARKEGTLGAVKGLGKGVVNLTAKSGAGMFGMFAYPSAGIAKSLRSAVHNKTRNMIAQERHKEGRWMIQSESIPELNSGAVVAEFERLRDCKSL